MPSVRVASTERAPSSYRNTLAIMPSPMSSFSEDDLSSFYPTVMSNQHFDAAGPAPALPMKSKLRASRLIIPTSSPEPISITERALTASPTTATPHDVYMSSEEDASSTADDASDCDWDSDSDEICNAVPSTASSAMVIPNTVRVVSVVFSGKPSVVELSGRRSASPRLRQRQDSSSSSTSSLSVPASLPVRPVSMFTSATPKASSDISLPTSISTSFGAGRARPSFLSVDPYATAPPPSSNSSYSSLASSPVSFASSEASEPATSTATATTTSSSSSSSSSHHSNMFKRTISLVRKKSRPTLNAASSSIREAIPEAALPPPTPYFAPSMPQTPATPGIAMSYDEILRAAKRSVSAGSPASSSMTASPSAPVISTPVKNRLLSLARKRNARV